MNESRDPGEALDRAMRDGDADGIARILMGNMWFFYNRDYATLQSAVALLTDEVLAKHPVLRLVHPLGGVLAQTGRPFGSEEFESLLEEGDPATVGLILMLQGIATRVSGDIAAAMRSAQRLEEWMGSHEFAASAHGGGPLWLFHHQIGSTYLVAGDTVAALRHFGAARQIGIPSGSADAERSAAGRVALVHAIRGSLGEAERSLGEALALPEPTAAYATAAHGTERATAALLSVELLADDADQRIAELRAIDNFEIIWPFELLAKARLAFGRHDPSAALEHANMAAATHRVQAGSFGADLIEATNIEALLALGDLTAAEHAVHTSRSRGPMTRLAVIQAAIHRGDSAQAHEELRYLGARMALSPLQRAQAAMFAIRLDALRGGQVTSHLAEEFARAVTRQGYRRLATTMPATVVPLVRARLSPDSARAFGAATADLIFADSSGSVSRALTDGERRVLEALPRHETVADIAAALHVSPNTIKTQLRSLYQKIGVGNRADAIEVSRRMASTHRDG